MFFFEMKVLMCDMSNRESERKEMMEVLKIIYKRYKRNRCIKIACAIVGGSVLGAVSGYMFGKLI